MDEVFEQTLSAAPLTERALFAEVRGSLSRYAVARAADWRGADARGGALHSAAAAAADAPAETDEPAVADSPAPSAGFFAAASEAAKGGRRGADFARALQRWLLMYVDTLALDEIELMAVATDNAAVNA